MTTERQSMEVDIACVGFGPATGGFLTTLSHHLFDKSGQPRFESRVMPGMPPQIVCYERADDISFGVSGLVTRARALRESFPDVDSFPIPMSCPVKQEHVLYLQDPHGASRRSASLRAADWLIRVFRGILPYDEYALRLPYIPPFLRKDGGFILSLGQLNQWVGTQLMASGAVQIWPGAPVSGPLLENGKVTGVRLVDQGTDLKGNPDVGYTPGMDIQAALTVVGDGPVGAVSQDLDNRFGLPPGNHQREWAVGVKMVVELPEESELEPGTVLHTFGYPEPEIFGFLYAYPDRLASLGIFVPSWMDSPVRTGYQYLQYWMTHPYLWRYLKGGTLRSWGAKSLQESGKHGEPYLVGDGYARIGENSGSTNVLTGSGVDEAWATGVQLAEGVVELFEAGKSFTRENLEEAYVHRRRQSWVEQEGRVAEKARDGFQRSFITGLMGMGLTGMTGGKLNFPGRSKPPHARAPSLEEYYKDKLSAEEIKQIREEATGSGTALHSLLLKKCGWPEIPYDGKLLVSQQDALLLGGKVQAASGYADHVVFVDPSLCEACNIKLCVEMCSGQAITPGEESGVPEFDREKCVHCGACLWSCTQPREDAPEHGNIEFRAGVGGLHSAEN